MKIRFTFRRWVGPLIAASLLAIAALMPLTGGTAYAAGETFGFSTYPNVINATGGVFGNTTVPLTLADTGYYTGSIFVDGKRVIFTVGNVTKNPAGGYNATFVASNSNTSTNIQVTDLNGIGPNGGSKGGPAGGGDPAANPPANAEKDTKEPEDCPIPPGESYRWLFCPVFTGINKTTSVLDAFINTYLSTGNTIFETNEPQYKAAWQTFRNFSVGLLVIAGLVMLVSEALSLSIIDAYTVRKVLPRLLVAVIGISLSWELCRFLIGFFDDLGAAAGNIIYSSFGIGVGGINIAESISAVLLAGGGIAAVSLTLGTFGIISLFGTLILAMLAGAVVLILRQAIIVMLVLAAPLAIAAYVLPNTNKMAKFWWDTLIRMLMLYPIATGLIALCKVLGNIAMSNPTGVAGAGAKGTIGGGIDGIIAFVSGMIFFIGGYALIPLAFRLTGGLVATIGGLANDRARGGFDRLKNYRKGQSEKNIGAMKEGRRFRNNNNPLSRRFNSATRGANNFATSQNKLGYMSLNRDNRLAARQASGTQGVISQSAEFAKSKEAQALMENDPALQALTFRDAATARAGLTRAVADGGFGMDAAGAESAVRAVQASGGWSAARSQFAAKQLFATGTGYANARQAIETSNRVAGNNDGSYADIVGYGNAVTASKGRFDLKGGFGEYVRQRQVLTAQAAAGRPVQVDDAQQTAFYRSAVEGNDAVSFLRGKPAGVANVAPVIRDHMAAQQQIVNTSTDPAAREAARYEASRYAGIIENFEQQGAMYAAPQVKQTVHQQMVNPTSGDAELVAFAPAGTVTGASRPAVQNQSARRAVVRDAAGDPMLDAAGNPIIAGNTEYRRSAEAGSREQSGGRFDPRSARDRLDE